MQTTDSPPSVLTRFKSFPQVLYEVLSLETVLLGNNQVCGVDPGRLIKLVHLTTLDLSNNDLLNIPGPVYQPQVSRAGAISALTVNKHRLDSILHTLTPTKLSLFE